MILFCAFALILFSIGFIVHMILQLGIDYDGQAWIESIILTIAIVIMPVFLLIIMYLFIDEYVLVFDYEILIPTVRQGNGIGVLVKKDDKPKKEVKRRNSGDERTGDNLIRNSNMENSAVQNPM